MIIFTVNGATFNNRQEAKTTLGAGRFRRLLKQGLIKFVFDTETESNEQNF